MEGEGGRRGRGERSRVNKARTTACVIEILKIGSSLTVPWKARNGHVFLSRASFSFLSELCLLAVTIFGGSGRKTQSRAEWLTAQE